MRNSGNQFHGKEVPRDIPFFCATFIDFWRVRELISHTVKKPLDLPHPGASRLLHGVILRNREDATIVPRHTHTHSLK